MALKNSVRHEDCEEEEEEEEGGRRPRSVKSVVGSPSPSLSLLNERC